MISKNCIKMLEQSSYEILQINQHDATIHSGITGHDWIIVSNYGSSNCYILHRHSNRSPYHRQRGSYKSPMEALRYIDQHEKWFLAEH